MPHSPARPAGLSPFHTGGGDADRSVVILSAVRTPIGGRKGRLRELSAMQLGVLASRAALERAGQAADSVGEVLFGNVIQAGSGQNIARQISVNAGLPVTVPAATVNQVCGSSLKALDLARQAILIGSADAVLVGGTENMAQAPALVLDSVRQSGERGPSAENSGEIVQHKGTQVSDVPSISSLLRDGLTDAFSGEPMGMTAENVARVCHVSREDQDTFAVRSHRLAVAAADAGRFADEIVPVTLSDGTKVVTDETIRADTSQEVLASLKPAFADGSTVTAGNSSSINVGASAMVLASGQYAARLGIEPLARIVDVTEVGIDPQIMGLAPRDAINALLERNGLQVEDIDLFEINEAFAATTLAVIRELGIPVQKVNVNGGAIALGHPLGATGARMVSTLAHELARTGGRYGVASLCVGGGMGLAVLLERGGSGHAEPQPDTDVPMRYLTPAQRRARLVAQGRMTREQAAVLAGESSASADSLTDLIENGIGRIVTPVGVVPGLVVNGTKYDVPLATEEPSVVAAASNGAGIVARSGGFDAHTLSRAMIGQVVIANPRDPELANRITAQIDAIATCANAAHPSILRRGGGVRGVQVREIWADGDEGIHPDETLDTSKQSRDLTNEGNGGEQQSARRTPAFMSVDVTIDVCDAMGANIVDTMMEAVASLLRVLYPNEQVLLGILSNYATQALTRVTCAIPFEDLVSGKAVTQAGSAPASDRREQGRRIAEAIVLASQLAQVDSYRAATHNKGIMNGIEAVVLATGNDTRAIEAACHSYAARDGGYRGLSTWRLGRNDDLVGEMTVPMPIATVGGGSAALPAARVALGIIGAQDAAELGRVVASVGLAQNLAAVKALVTDGIQRGHMSLQAHALAVAAGAKGSEIEAVATTLTEQGTAHISLQSAQQVLATLRGNHRA